MQTANSRHSINGLAEILNWMVSQGYEQSVLMSNTGIDDQRLQDPNSTVSPKEELTFYQNLIDVSKDKHIILKAGLNLKISAYGMWGLALLSSPTFGKAIELGLQYVDFTYTYNRIQLFTDNKQAGLRISKLSQLGMPLQQHMIERDLSAIFVLFQALLQTPAPFDEIHLSLPKADPCFEALFNCPVSFGYRENEVRFAATLLGQALPQQNAMTVQLCTQQLEQIRPELHEGNSSTEKVSNYLLRTQLFKANIEECAQQLNMSARQLRRKLSAEESSFQSLLDNFRHVLAKKYLLDTNMNLDAIAERLGYSDAANFSHAFKRWSGCSPRSLKRR
jgi:AraC-like DNA-binding protein